MAPRTGRIFGHIWRDFSCQVDTLSPRQLPGIPKTHTQSRHQRAWLDLRSHHYVVCSTLAKSSHPSNEAQGTYSFRFLVLVQSLADSLLGENARGGNQSLAGFLFSLFLKSSGFFFFKILRFLFFPGSSFCPKCNVYTWRCFGYMDFIYDHLTPSEFSNLGLLSIFTCPDCIMPHL